MKQIFVILAIAFFILIGCSEESNDPKSVAEKFIIISMKGDITKAKNLISDTRDDKQKIKMYKKAQVFNKFGSVEDTEIKLVEKVQKNKENLNEIFFDLFIRNKKSSDEFVKDFQRDPIYQLKLIIENGEWKVRLI